MAHFVSSCRSNGFHGDVRNAWFELADGSTLRHICLKDWDPEADMLLRTFCKVLVQRHKQLREGWCAILKHGFGGKSDGGHLSSKEFLDIITGLGFSLRHAKIVLAAIDKDRDEVITMEEFLFVSQFGQGLEPPKELSERPDASRPPRRHDHGTSLRERNQKEEPPRWTSAPITDTPDKHNKDDEGTIVQHTCSDKPPLDSNEFVVFMTKDEYNEFLRRRRKKTMSAMANESQGMLKEQREERKQRRDSKALSQPILIHGSQPVPVKIERVRKAPQVAKQEGRRAEPEW